MQANNPWLQHRSFHVKFAKFLSASFFREHLQWMLQRLNLCFQRSPEQKPVQLSAINTKFCWKKVFAVAKIQKQPPQVFCKRRPATLLERGSSIAKFLRTPFWKIYVNDNFRKSVPQWHIYRKEIIPDFFILLNLLVS